MTPKGALKSLGFFERGRRSDRDYAVSWVKPFGNGRVFYTSLGHYKEVWEDRRYQNAHLGRHPLGLGFAIIISPACYRCTAMKLLLLVGFGGQRRIDPRDWAGAANQLGNSLLERRHNLSQRSALRRGGVLNPRQIGDTRLHAAISAASHIDEATENGHVRRL